MTTKELRIAHKEAAIKWLRLRIASTEGRITTYEGQPLMPLLVMAKKELDMACERLRAVGVEPSRIRIHV